MEPEALNIGAPGDFHQMVRSICTLLHYYYLKKKKCLLT